ncbi:CASP-like protein 4D1 [Camellia lanceoleosa]|uniref:CASP-like protein 4D1 n=1 Tax=Camellia lanceoleosa TaxID=1840588 RepID=A0ACC0FBQ8_9ERIC|nr:CASP-like protein 4D1 [Camellia lanceoleosa]
MANSKKSIANSTLVLRIFTLIILAASVVVMATDNFKLSDGSKTSFKDIVAYRFVITTGVIGFVYTTLQLPFAIYYVCTEKRLDCLPEFDFYGDKIISFLLATGVGAGFAVTHELKRIIQSISDDYGGLDEQESKTISFLNRGYIATGILFAGFICMAILSILSSINRNERKGFFG